MSGWKGKRDGRSSHSGKERKVVCKARSGKVEAKGRRINGRRREGKRV